MSCWKLRNGLLSKTGVVKLPILGGIKQYKRMVILREFPYNNALFGLVIYSDPCSNEVALAGFFVLQQPRLHIVW